MHLMSLLVVPSRSSSSLARHCSKRGYGDHLCELIARIARRDCNLNEHCRCVWKRRKQERPSNLLMIIALPAFISSPGLLER